MRKYKPGDFVACYLTNTEVYEELLTWGLVVDVSPTLEDILVLDKTGKTHWWPSRRWTLFRAGDHKSELKEIDGILA